MNKEEFDKLPIGIVLIIEWKSFPGFRIAMRETKNYMRILADYDNVKVGEYDFIQDHEYHLYVVAPKSISKLYEVTP